MRTVVLPVLRLLVWAIIAVALCVIAFGGGDSKASGDALSPEMSQQQATVPVTKHDVRSVIELTGTVEADPAVKVKASSAGSVSRLRAGVGDEVETGTPLFDVVVQLAPGTSTTTNPDGSTATKETPRTRTDVVKATTGGKLTSLDVLKGQEITVGTEVAAISPGTLKVKAPLTQSEQFRLLTPPQAAQAQAKGGPAPFECGSLSTGAKLAATNDNPEPNPNLDPFGGGGPVPESTTAEITCTVPAGATVFAGMSVDLTVDTGSAPGALTVPLSAVQGSVGAGNVWVPGPGGVPLKKAVKLGLSDGTKVQITEGLSDGDEVLEFAPVGADDPPAANSGDEQPAPEATG